MILHIRLDEYIGMLADFPQVVNHDVGLILFQAVPILFVHLKLIQGIFQKGLVDFVLSFSHGARDYELISLRQHALVKELLLRSTKYMLLQNRSQMSHHFDCHLFLVVF